MKAARRFTTACMAVILCVTILISVSAEATEIPISNKSEKKVALTFDDGPHPRYTKEILEILREHGIRATFFVIGINAERYPTVLREIVNAQCEIGNHTYSHTAMSKLTKEALRNEMLDCEEIIFRQTAMRTRLFRPPEGQLTQTAKEAANDLDYKLILWDVDTLDWAHTPVERIVSKVVENVKDGDVILMHDYISGKNTTCDALRLLIPRLKQMGYTFVTVSELNR